MPVHRASGKQRKRSQGYRTVTISARELARRLKQQKAQRKLDLQEKKARAAVKSFRPRKKDKGKIVMVGLDGGHSPQLKGRKGFAVYVTKTGKKQLLKRQKGQPFQPVKVSDLELPLDKKTAKAVKQFQRSRLVKTSQHKSLLKGKGKVTAGGQYDFSEKISTKIAKSLKKTIEKQASHRSFLVTIIALVRLPDGSERTYETVVPIAKADHIAIRLEGLENFVRRKIYAFLARELAFDGYVTSGSANHIRRLKENKGEDMEDWTQDDGQRWRGNESEVVTIISLEWKIEQAK